MKKESPKIEEYLEAVYRKAEKGERATTKEIAGALGVSQPSVTQMFKKLAKSGFLKHEPRRGVSLTKKGGEVGRSVLRKHRLLEGFLTLLGVGKSKVHNEACKLEHAVSDEVEEKMRRVISSSGGAVLEGKSVKKITDLSAGAKGRIVFIAGGRGASQRLSDLGMTPGEVIRLDSKSSFGGPVRLCVRSCCIAVGRGIAEKIFVEAV